MVGMALVATLVPQVAVASGGAPGEEVWVSLLPEPHAARAVEASPDGSRVFAAGHGSGVDGSTHLTAAIDVSSGHWEWLDSRASGDWHAAALAVAPAGDRVFVVGENLTQPCPFGGSRGEATLNAYAADGEHLWAAWFGFNLDDRSGGIDVAVSPDGSRVYAAVAVTTFGEPPCAIAPPVTSQEIVLLAYSAATGDQLWEHRFAAEQHNARSVLAVTPDGSTVVAAGLVADGSDIALRTVAVEADTGAHRWTVTDPPPAGAGEPMGLAIAASTDSARVFVTRHVDGYHTVAYDSVTGAQQWVARLEGPHHPASLDVSPDGSAVYVTGLTTSSDQYTTVSYDAGDGTQGWAATTPGRADVFPGNVWSVRLVARPDGSGVLVLAPTETGNGLSELAADDGSTRWTVELTGQPEALAVSPDSTRAYVAGSREVGESEWRFAVAAYRLDGGDPGDPGDPEDPGAPPGDPDGGGSAVPPSGEPIAPGPQPDGDHTTVEVAEGEEVTVSAPTEAGEVVVTFNGVPEGGTMTVTVHSSPPAQGGLRFLDTWFELTADFDFERAEVCVPYDADAARAAGWDPDDVTLFHQPEGEEPSDVTTSVNGGQICGVVTRFSGFLVGDTTTTRIAGADRYDTAARISASAFPAGATTAFVAYGGDFPDALAAGAAAAAEAAPVLLTTSEQLHPAARRELRRLDPGTVVVVGGRASVPEHVLAQIREASGATVQRRAGGDRYATAAAVARHHFPTATDTVYVATGIDYPDALAAGPAAARDGAPLLLVPRDRLPAVVAAELRRLAPREVILLGGRSAVSETTEQAIRQETGADVLRIGGADRYTTAATLAHHFPRGSLPYVAAGHAFADALAAGPAAATTSSPLLLVARDALPPATERALSRLNTPTATLLGGAGAIARNTEIAVARQLRSPTEARRD